MHDAMHKSHEKIQQRSAPDAGARLLWKAEAGKAVSARHIQQRMPRWKVYAVRLLSTTSGAPAAETRTATTAGGMANSSMITAFPDLGNQSLWMMMIHAQQHSACVHGTIEHEKDRCHCATTFLQIITGQSCSNAKRGTFSW